MNTLFDKIWDAHVVTTVEDGPTQLYIDRLYCHEVTSPQAFAGLRERGIGVLRPEKVFCMPDHNTPTHDQDKEIETNVTTRRICLSIVALALNLINWKCWARWLKAVHEVLLMYFQLILPKIEKRSINYVGRISKLGTTDYSLSVKNNTNICWHERKHCAR